MLAITLLFKLDEIVSDFRDSSSCRKNRPFPSLVGIKQKSNNAELIFKRLIILS